MNPTPLSSLAITMGDPCGVGPEVVVRALAGMGAAEQPWVLGCSARLAQAAALCGVAVPARVLQVGASVAGLPWGEVNAQAGGAAFAYIDEAIAMARRGEVAGIVTAPINKASLNAAGHHYPGHTEILQDKSFVLSDRNHKPATKKVAMMLANDELRTVLVTIHCSLAQVFAGITIPAQLHAMRLAHAALQRMGVRAPRVAVAGLNPHAGEGGLFGCEEIEVIAPAVALARAEGIDASGPWPGDTVFMQARGALVEGTNLGLQSTGKFDVVVAQYHDQGLIPVKYLGIDQGVNITLGLPFVRTSPDHGTAFDIAGTGVASAASMQTALRYAARLVGIGKEVQNG